MSYWAVLLIFATAGGEPPPTSSDRPTLAEITAALAKWRNSIHTMRIRIEWTYEPGHLDSKDRGWPGPGYSYGLEWTWTETGSYKLYTWTNKDGTRIEDELRVVNENRRYHFRNPRGDPPTMPDSVEIDPVRLGAGPAPMDVIPERGVWFARMDWLKPELRATIGVNPWKWEFPPELFDDHETIRLKLRRRHRGDPSRRYIKWLTLDPAHGYLPRFVESGSARYRISKFRFIAPPGLWFPVRGTRTFWDPSGKIYSRTMWHITEVELNKPYDASVFEPTIPEGTEVIDKTVAPSSSNPKKNEDKTFWPAMAALLLFLAAAGWLCLRTWRILRPANESE